MQKFFTEISSLKNEQTHRSALRIQTILNDNPEPFIKAFGKDNYEEIKRSFDLLAESSPSFYRSVEYKTSFSRSFESLSYWLNRMMP